MLEQLTCKTCDCSRDFVEQDDLFTCQTCGTRYPIEYIVEETRQRQARDIICLFHNHMENDIPDEVVVNCLQSALGSFISSDFKKVEHLCDIILESDNNNYFAWLLKGEAICFQLTLPVFERTVSTPATGHDNQDNAASLSEPSPKFSGDSVVQLQSALFNLQFSKVINCFMEAISTASDERLDDIVEISLNISFNETLAVCLRMLDSLVEIPVVDNASAYASEKVQLVGETLTLMDAACSCWLERSMEDSSVSLDWDTFDRWLSKHEFHTSTKIWETELKRYKADHDGHPSQEALGRLLDALCTSILMIEILLLTGPLEELSQDELTLGLTACDKAISMCQEAKEFKWYQMFFKNRTEFYETIHPMKAKVLDERIESLCGKRKQIEAAIKNLDLQ